ncbi:hypothetical protein [Herbaspirillum rubrisubalbicans]|uniref:hypothetical protein n=1 Tax=Herbaspirillum rubrisubalbicans TaxID=80842 RepID=UPI0002FBBABA|nr:hypothetical protein [Herbaspirillum rubrisubalbicans]
MRQLGDGFYEQQLIQRQIQEATGQRYLRGFNSNEAQYLALMQAGLQQAQAQRLRWALPSRWPMAARRKC